MLSDNLRALRDHLMPYLGVGVELNGAAVTAIVAILDAAVDDAHALQANTAPAGSEPVGDDNVVQLDRFRRRPALFPLDGGAA